MLIVGSGGGLSRKLRAARDVWYALVPKQRGSFCLGSMVFIFSSTVMDTWLRRGIVIGCCHNMAD